MEDFEKIYADYYQAVYRYALSLCRDREWAEEITQESFFKALKSIDSFPGRLQTAGLALSDRKKHLLYRGKEKKQPERIFPRAA